MAITYESRSYGTRPWQRMLYGSDTTEGSTTKPVFIFVPPGGWGIQDLTIGTNAAHPIANQVIHGALNRAADASNYEDYRIFILQTATGSHNQYDRSTGVANWVTATDYTRGDLIQDGGSTYRCISDHASNDPANNPPNTLYWDPIVLNDCSKPIVAGRGDSTSGYNQQAVFDIQQAIAHIRSNATLYDIHPDQIAIMGSSSGGSLIATAAYGAPMPSAGLEGIQGMHPLKPSELSTPNAIIMHNTPTALDQFALASTVNQAPFFADMDTAMGLIGTNFASWSNLPADTKKAFDPLRTLERTRKVIPTYLDYQGTKLNDTTPTVIYDGDGGNLIQGHHAYHGWLVLNELTRTVALGGHDNTDVRFFVEGTAANVYRTYTLIPDTADLTDEGTNPTNYSSQIGLDLSTDAGRDTHADDIVNWLNTVMSTGL